MEREARTLPRPHKEILVVYQITYKDGTVEIVERCWLVECPRSKLPKKRMRWAVQRRHKTKLRWYSEEDITDVKYENGDVQLGTPGPRKAG